MVRSDAVHALSHMAGRLSSCFTHFIHYKINWNATLEGACFGLSKVNSRATKKCVRVLNSSEDARGHSHASRTIGIAASYLKSMVIPVRKNASAAQLHLGLTVFHYIIIRCWRQRNNTLFLATKQGGKSKWQSPITLMNPIHKNHINSPKLSSCHLGHRLNHNCEDTWKRKSQMIYQH